MLRRSTWIAYIRCGYSPILLSSPEYRESRGREQSRAERERKKKRKDKERRTERESARARVRVRVRVGGGGCHLAVAGIHRRAVQPRLPPGVEVGRTSLSTSECHSCVVLLLFFGLTAAQVFQELPGKLAGRASPRDRAGRQDPARGADRADRWAARLQEPWPGSRCQQVLTVN